MMTNTNYILRFLLEGGHSLEAIMSEALAKRYVTDWGNGELKGRLRGTDPDGRHWAVDSARIQALCTIDPVKLQQQQLEYAKMMESQQRKPSATDILRFPPLQSYQS